nr:PREDICTED: retinol dehydrogenase 11-like isoform X1 [Bemisia tabaci]
MALRIRFKIVIVFVLLVGLLGNVDSGFFRRSKSGSSGGSSMFSRFRKWRIPRVMSKLFYKMYKGNERIGGKVAIVTGSNTGIGKVTALELCKRGARVIMACRTTHACEKAAEDIRKKTEGLEGRGTVECKYLDLSIRETVYKFADDILRTGTPVNYLINNAGVMACPYSITPDGQEWQFQVNHLSHFLLTMKLLPRIIKSAPSRIITVSSLAHMFSSGNMYYDDITMKKNYKPKRAYARSKLANIWFSRILAKRLRELGISKVTTYSLHTGIAVTEMTRHFDKVLNKWIKDLYESNFVKWFVRTPEEGAQTTLYCALDEAAGLESGEYYSNCHKAKPLRAARSGRKNDEKAEKLWDWSWNWSGLGNYNPYSPM